MGQNLEYGAQRHADRLGDGQNKKFLHQQVRNGLLRLGLQHFSIMEHGEILLTHNQGLVQRVEEVRQMLLVSVSHQVCVLQ